MLNDKFDSDKHIKAMIFSDTGDENSVKFTRFDSSMVKSY